MKGRPLRTTLNPLVRDGDPFLTWRLLLLIFPLLIGMERLPLLVLRRLHRMARDGLRSRILIQIVRLTRLRRLSLRVPRAFALIMHLLVIRPLYILKIFRALLRPGKGVLVLMVVLPLFPVLALPRVAPRSLTLPSRAIRWCRVLLLVKLPGVGVILLIRKFLVAILSRFGARLVILLVLALTVKGMILFRWRILFLRTSSHGVLRVPRHRIRRSRRFTNLRDRPLVDTQRGTVPVALLPKVHVLIVRRRGLPVSFSRLLLLLHPVVGCRIMLRGGALPSRLSLFCWLLSIKRRNYFTVSSTNGKETVV